MERRQFIRSSCNVCLMAAGGFLLADLAACSPSSNILKAAVVNNTVQVPLSSFNTGTLQLVRPAGWNFDIAVMKNANDQFNALLMQCTHQQNQLINTPNGYTCTLHGSQFDKTGKVLKGPAERALKSYETSIEQNQLIIHLI